MFLIENECKTLIALDLCNKFADLPINCSYGPHKYNIGTHIARLRKSLDKVPADYEKIIIFGDFNFETDENHKKPFYKNYEITNLLTKASCYKLIQHVQI